MLRKSKKVEGIDKCWESQKTNILLKSENVEKIEEGWKNLKYRKTLRITKNVGKVKKSIMSKNV